MTGRTDHGPVDLAGRWALRDETGEYEVPLDLPGGGITALQQAGAIPDPYRGRAVNDGPEPAQVELSMLAADMRCLRSLAQTAPTRRSTSVPRGCGPTLHLRTGRGRSRPMRWRSSLRWSRTGPRPLDDDALTLIPGETRTVTFRPAAPGDALKFVLRDLHSATYRPEINQPHEG